MRALAGLLLVALAAPARGEDVADSLHARLDLARALAAEGRAARDPLALIVAARIRRDLAMSPRGAAAADPAGLDGPASLVAEARRLAGRDRRLSALADDILASGEKGRARGPLYEIGKLAALARETHGELRFAGGRRAEVYIEATRPVTLAVRGGDGLSLCAPPVGAVAYCWWTPAAETSVAVEIVNTTREPLAYRLVTN